MDRQQTQRLMSEPEMLDYGVYLNCERLLTCQKPFEALCNHDELQFQIVHQVEELWMKLIAYSLIEVEERLGEGVTHRALSLLDRCHRLIRLMTAQLDVLETMSPKDYQQIRLQLGNGSGQESPGFRLILKMPSSIWTAYVQRYLTPEGRTVATVYDSGYAHDAAYALAEALIEFDELFQKFRWHHIFLIHRSIGMGAASLKGRPVEILEIGAKHRFFPELWEIRSQMTDAWGVSYGSRRDSLASPDTSG